MFKKSEFFNLHSTKKLSEKMFFSGVFYPYEKLNWQGLDSLENFKHNSTKYSTLPKHNLWLENPVVYNHNNYGFRSKDDYHTIEQEQVSFFIGCSFTYGIGLNLEQTWPYKLSEKNNERIFYNFSVPGSGIDTAFRLLNCWIPIIKPKVVYSIGFFSHRREFFNNNRAGLRGEWNDFEFFQNISIDEENLNIEKNKKAIFYLLNKYQVEIISPDEYWIKQCYELTKKDQARDLIHPGESCHNMIISDMSKWKPVSF